MFAMKQPTATIDMSPSQSTTPLVAVEQALISPATSDRIAQTFKAMADPTRVRILHALALAELCVCDLAGLVGISESAVSHQLGLLRALRIVRRRKTGRHVYYALEDEHIRSLIEQGLAHQTHE